MDGILLLAVIIFGFSLMLGKGKIENFFKFLILLLIAPVLITFGIDYLRCSYNSLPLWMQIISILLIPLLLLALLRLAFPKVGGLQKLQTLIFEALVFAFTFPFRFLWRSGRFIFQKEGRTTRLNPHRAAVGNKPPVVNRFKRRENENNLFE